MNRKQYTSPEVEIEKFLIKSIITTSGDLDEDANNDINDPWNGDDDF